MSEDNEMVETDHTFEDDNEAYLMFPLKYAVPE